MVFFKIGKRIIQKTQLRQSLPSVTFPSWVKGVKGSSVVDHALTHLPFHASVQIDLTQCFNTIQRRYFEVPRFLKELNHVHSFMTFLSACIERHPWSSIPSNFNPILAGTEEVLTQGPNSSPLLANIHLVGLDLLLLACLREAGLICEGINQNAAYSRYVDNICISCNDLAKLQQITPSLLEIVRNFHLIPHDPEFSEGRRYICHILIDPASLSAKPSRKVRRRARALNHATLNSHSLIYYQREGLNTWINYATREEKIIL